MLYMNLLIFLPLLHPCATIKIPAGASFVKDHRQVFRVDNGFEVPGQNAASRRTENVPSFPSNSRSSSHISNQKGSFPNFASKSDTASIFAEPNDPLRQLQQIQQPARDPLPQVSQVLESDDPFRLLQELKRRVVGVIQVPEQLYAAQTTAVRVNRLLPGVPNASRLPAVPNASRLPAVPNASILPAVPHVSRLPAVPNASRIPTVPNVSRLPHSSPNAQKLNRPPQFIPDNQFQPQPSRQDPFRQFQQVQQPARDPLPQVSQVLESDDPFRQLQELKRRVVGVIQAPVQQYAAPTTAVPYLHHSNQYLTVPQPNYPVDQPHTFPPLDSQSIPPVQVLDVYDSDDSDGPFKRLQELKRKVGAIQAPVQQYTAPTTAVPHQHQSNQFLTVPPQNPPLYPQPIQQDPHIHQIPTHPPLPALLTYLLTHPRGWVGGYIHDTTGDASDNSFPEAEAYVHDGSR